MFTEQVAPPGGTNGLKLTQYLEEQVTCRGENFEIISTGYRDFKK